MSCQRPPASLATCRAAGSRRFHPLLFLLHLACSLWAPADSLRFTSIQMPALVQRGANFWLSCQFELMQEHANHLPPHSGGGGGDEQLYSVKWYKNNEEFYRLIFGPPNTQTPAASNGVGDLVSWQPAAAAAAAATATINQEQYFTQPGVNVLMSASNATHVRLLNASLESDGSYACEISTQNLSTIRYEKEIRVYVLPSAKLNLIGLRSLYALNDRVELNCVSDFSRPAAALGWFINGHRLITTTSSSAAANNQHFLVERQLIKPKPGEPKLARSSLSLKFRLTNEVLAASARQEARHLLGLSAWPEARGGGGGGGGGEQTARRNQSKLQLLNGHDEGVVVRPAAPGARLHELLKLECRYKLTEVSDVTFNELRVATTTTTAAGRSATSGVDGKSRNAQRRRRLNRRTVSNMMSQRRRLPAANSTTANNNNNNNNRLSLTKSLANQVQQSSCPARRDALRTLLAATARLPAQTADACRPGLLALSRDDPLIVEARDEEEEEDGDGDGDDGEPNNEEEERDRGGAPERADDHRLELPVGASVGVNCSALGALLAAPVSPRALYNGDEHQRQQEGQVQSLDGQSVIYCGDIEARKRLLISGKYQQKTTSAAAPAPSSGANQRHKSGSHQASGRHTQHVAYVSFDAHSTGANSSSPSASDNNGRRQAPADKSSLPPPPLVADSSNLLQLEGPKSLGQLHRRHHQHPHNAEHDTNNHFHNHHEMQQSAWSAPPLLEWFINNQEAPRSSVSYWPELPLTPSLGRQQMATGDGSTSQPTTTTTSEEEPSQLPSIDYREYFANFDSRTTDQHLMLRLALEKRHFMTPDSLLKLRCTSTQAQVLALESLEVSLNAIPPGTSLKPDQLDQQQPRQEAPNARNHRPSASNWHQRQPSNQIKSKYLHRQSASGAHVSSPEGAQQRPYHNQYNGNSSAGAMPLLQLRPWCLLQVAALVWSVLTSAVRLVEPSIRLESVFLK